MAIRRPLNRLKTTQEKVTQLERCWIEICIVDCGFCVALKFVLSNVIIYVLNRDIQYVDLF